MTEAARKKWTSDGGTRTPITLAPAAGAAPKQGAPPGQGETEDDNQSKPADSRLLRLQR
jgi:hypothetical protein